MLTIQSQRVNAPARDKIRYIKQYLEAAVRKAFADLTQIPDVPSARIEDLRDLDRIEPALEQLEALGQRQALLEHSQDRARAAFRDVLDALSSLRALPEELAALRERVRELEQQLQHTITPAQRGAIYQAVQRWGEVRALHQPADQPGVSVRRCWTEFNQRFHLASYSQLPAAQYDAAIAFVKAQYHTLTGRDLDAVEQTGLDL